MGDSAWGGAFNPRRMLETALSETDFESVSHEQMRSMIEAADPETTSKLGGKLKKAAVVIEEIGTELRTRMTAVAWEGEGGEAFREWGAKVANETLRLSEFSRTSGAWLTEAATVLAEVKGAMPPPSSGSRALLDAFFERNPGGRLMLSEATVAQSKDSGGNSVLMGPTPKQALAAQTRLNEDHAEAVRLMTKLAGSYRWSSMNMSAAERPAFPPPPAAVMPKRREVDGVEYRPDGKAGTESGRPAGSDDVPAGTSPSGRQSIEPSSRVADVVRRSETPIQPDAGAAMGLAGGVAAPQAPQTGPAAGPAQTGGNVPTSSGGFGLPVSPVPPVAMRGVNGTFGGPTTGRSSPPVGRPMTGQPVANGAAGRPTSRGPVDHGIVGGRPTPPNSGRPAGAIPRGTVVGNEPAHGYGRGAMGSGGTMGGVGRGSGHNAAGGRRLASEPGGTAGNRVQRSGVVGQPSAPSGTGVARGLSGQTPNGLAGGRGGAAPNGGARSSPARASRAEGRRDHLTEDEETCTQNGRRVVPPVID